MQPGLPILLGGPHATMLHREILERFPQFDIVVRHEADETSAPLLEELDGRRFERIPGISWRASDSRPALRFTDGKPKVDDLDTLPITSYDHYPVADLGLGAAAHRGRPWMPLRVHLLLHGWILSAKLPAEVGRPARAGARSPARAIWRPDFKLDHDMFTVNRRKVIEFCKAVTDRGYRWRASARVDCVDGALLATMAESGCVGLYFGIETGSARMQQICQKRLDLDLVQPILDAAAHLGIETTASFITGYPEESEETRTIRSTCWAGVFRPGCLPQLHILAPEPGTPMFDLRRDTIDYDGYGGPYNASLTDEDDRRLVLDQPDIFSTYYYYPADMPRERYIFAVETAQLLRRAGPILVQYLLRAHDGRLSMFVADLRRFADAHRPGRAPDAETLDAYIRETFGSAHHMTSLFRVRAGATSRNADGDQTARDRSAGFDPDMDYELNPDVEILADMHDCQLLIERINGLGAGSRLLDDAEAGERAVCLIAFSAGTATSYRMDPGAEPIIRLFEQRRSCRDVMELLSRSRA